MSIAETFDSNVKEAADYKYKQDAESNSNDKN